jgi:hypothetical protein
VHCHWEGLKKSTYKGDSINVSSRGWLGAFESFLSESHSSDIDYPKGFTSEERVVKLHQKSKAIFNSYKHSGDENNFCMELEKIADEVRVILEEICAIEISLREESESPLMSKRPLEFNSDATLTLETLEILDSRFKEHNPPEKSEEANLINRNAWLLDLKFYSQEMIAVLDEWSESFEKGHIQKGVWELGELPITMRDTSEDHLSVFTPEEISSYLKENLLDHPYSFLAEEDKIFQDDFKKAYDKISKKTKDNILPEEYSSDVIHLHRFLEVVAKEIDSKKDEVVDGLRNLLGNEDASRDPKSRKTKDILHWDMSEYMEAVQEKLDAFSDCSESMLSLIRKGQITKHNSHSRDWWLGKHISEADLEDALGVEIDDRFSFDYYWDNAESDFSGYLSISDMECGLSLAIDTYNNRQLPDDFVPQELLENLRRKVKSFKSGNQPGAKDPIDCYSDVRTVSRKAAFYAEEMGRFKSGFYKKHKEAGGGQRPK